MVAPRSLADWLAWHEQRHPRTIDLGLERVGTVAARLGLLPLRQPSVIVGGTNGKGSTAATLAALLQASGLRTGLFTSPHLLRYNERIQIAGVPVTDQQLCAAFERIEAASDGVSLSFFEYNALAALELFARPAVDAVVLEVGLGGRLDATNIVSADVAVICSIGLDHTDWLGDTLEQIATEKAGILRAGHDLVLGNDTMPTVIGTIATRLGCRTHIAGHDFMWMRHGDQRWDYWSPSAGGAALRSLPAPVLTGDVQYRNAATAIAAFAALHSVRPDQVPAPDVESVATGLRGVRLPGRMQVLSLEAEWVLDVAHNVPAALVFAAELRRRAPVPRTLAVFGMLSDKDVAGVVRELDATVDQWLLCPTGEGRGVSADALSVRMGATRGGKAAFDSVAQACEQARRMAKPGDRVLVCGSFHVVGPALDWLGL